MQGFTSTGNFSSVNLFLVCSKLAESYGFIKTVQSFLRGRGYCLRLSPIITLVWLCSVTLHICVFMHKVDASKLPTVYTIQSIYIMCVCMYGVNVLCIHGVV